MQEEAFVKAQLVAFCKALSKVEAPLKQKHVRALVVGSHKMRSSRIFWHAVSRVQLEKNPVLTWKFCQLLHKLIHDGHRKVTEEGAVHVNRLAQLGSFWQHLRSSGYGQANTCYCKLLVSRLKFHKKYPSIPGNLNLTQRQLEALTSDVNETYELAIDMLDQMDELLNLKATIMQIMDSLRWSSLVPQGQCLLAPLIPVILDTSKLYDFLVKALFKLHASLPPDTLVGHRERFYDCFRRTKKFYEETANLQYFKYLVQIPTLPTTAPNFQQASELDHYQAPQAYLHAVDASESGDQSPPDAQSVCDEQINSIIDISMDADAMSMFSCTETASMATGPSTAQQPAPPLFDPKDEIIGRLRQDIDVERDTKERLIQEARIRIEQYETRLVQMKQEIDLHKEAAEERAKEALELRRVVDTSSTVSQVQQQQGKEEMERRAQESEQKYGKIRGVYQQLREDHIKALTEIRDLRTKIDTSEQVTSQKEEQLQTYQKELEQATQERAFFESQAKITQENVQTSAQSLHSTQSKLGQLQTELEDLKEELARERDEKGEQIRALQGQREKLEQDFLECISSSALAIMEQALEDMQNATSVTYPTALAAARLRALLELLDSQQPLLSTERPELVELCRPALLLTPNLADVLFTCASAAYGSSIQHFEGVSEQCRQVHALYTAFLRHLPSSAREEPAARLVPFEQFKTGLEQLEQQMKRLPSENSGDMDVETVGKQLEEEMRRMGEAIASAVAHIDELQRRSREANSGLRLEVNDNILLACNSLMAAVRELVLRSKQLQEEIVAQGGGGAGTASSTSTTPTEFYRRNHLWTEGLISAGRAVGVAASELVKSADSLIMGKGGKFEHLIVAAGSVGASVAQLFVTSRVKGQRGSQKLAQLGSASKAVNKCTAELVGAVKSGQQSLAEEQLLDFSNLSLHETKKEEMESQVRMLELESELTKERLRLASLRKQHFHLAQLVTNNNAGNNGGQEQNGNGNGTD